MNSTPKYTFNYEFIKNFAEIYGQKCVEKVLENLKTKSLIYQILVQKIKLTQKSLPDLMNLININYPKNIINNVTFDTSEFMNFITDFVNIIKKSDEKIYREILTKNIIAKFESDNQVKQQKRKERLISKNRQKEEIEIAKQEPITPAALKKTRFSSSNSVLPKKSNLFLNENDARSAIIEAKPGDASEIGSKAIIRAELDDANDSHSVVSEAKIDDSAEEFKKNFIVPAAVTIINKEFQPLNSLFIAYDLFGEKVLPYILSGNTYNPTIEYGISVKIFNEEWRKSGDNLFPGRIDENNEEEVKKYLDSFFN
jgi:hypothetical protein